MAQGGFRVQGLKSVQEFVVSWPPRTGRAHAAMAIQLSH